MIFCGMTHSHMNVQAESKAVVERNGKGLTLSVKQINGVLRF